VVARVLCSAIRDRTRVILCRVGLCTHGAGVVAGGTALGRVPEGLAFVALGGRAEGDVFGNSAFAARLVAPRDFFVISPIKVTIMEDASLPWRRSGLVSQRGVWPIRREGYDVSISAQADSGVAVVGTPWLLVCNLWRSWRDYVHTGSCPQSAQWAGPVEAGRQG